MTLDQISAYLLFHLTIESFLFMEMARRSKQEIVRKLPEELFFVIIFIFFWGGGRRERQKNVSNEHSNFSYDRKNSDCSTLSFSRD